MNTNSTRRGLFSSLVLLLSLYTVFLLVTCQADTIPLPQIVFPYTIQTPHYNATFKSPDAPNVDITAFLPNATSKEPNHLFSIQINNWYEIQGNRSFLWEYNSGPELAANFNRTILVQKVAAGNIDYSTFAIQEPNNIGIQYIAQLSNGAIFEFNYTINPNSSRTIPVPRERDDCSRSKRPAGSGNCSCNPNHVLDRNSLKFTFKLTNWTFTPLYSPDLLGLLRLQTTFTGPFNYDFYAQIPDFQQYIAYNTCDVGIVNFNLTTNSIPGQVIIPFSVFDNALIDDVPDDIGCLIDTFTVDGSNGEAINPVGFIFSQFEESLVFDPDLSILVSGSSGRGEDSGENSGGGGGDGGGAGDGTTGISGDKKEDGNYKVVVGAVVGAIGGATVLALVAVVVVALLVYIRRRTKKRVSDIRF